VQDEGDAVGRAVIRAEVQLEDEAGILAEVHPGRVHHAAHREVGGRGQAELALRASGAASPIATGACGRRRSA
jgi:hypothetical protein